MTLPAITTLASRDQLTEQLPDATLDLVPDRADLLDRLTGGVLELPVEVALSGVHRAGVPAPHGDHDIRGPDHVVRERLGELVRELDPERGHHLHRCGVDLVGRAGAGRADPHASLGVVIK